MNHVHATIRPQCSASACSGAPGSRGRKRGKAQQAPPEASRQPAARRQRNQQQQPQRDEAGPSRAGPAHLWHSQLRQEVRRIAAARLSTAACRSPRCAACPNNSCVSNAAFCRYPGLLGAQSYAGLSKCTQVQQAVVDLTASDSDDDLIIVDARGPSRQAGGRQSGGNDAAIGGRSAAAAGPLLRNGVPLVALRTPVRAPPAPSVVTSPRGPTCAVCMEKLREPSCGPCGCELFFQALYLSGCCSCPRLPRMRRCHYHMCGYVMQRLTGQAEFLLLKVKYVPHTGTSSARRA